MQVVAFVLAGFSLSASRENLFNKTYKKGEAAKETTETEMDYFHCYTTESSVNDVFCERSQSPMTGQRFSNMAALPPRREI